MADELEELIERVLGRLGLELVDFERAGGSARPILRLRIDRLDSERGGITVADCAADMGAGLLAHAAAIDQLLDQVTTPLPAEPIGVGGSWEVSNTITQDGLTVQETITCTLAASDGNTVEIVMDIQRHLLVRWRSE